MSQDLFENYKKLPNDVQTIIDKWFKKQTEEGLSYLDCKNFLKEIEIKGYTFDYELSAEPFNLRKKDN